MTGSRPGHAHEQRSHDGHHDHHHGHGHSGHGPGRVRRLVHALIHAVAPHSHDSGDKVDRELEASRDGLRALWTSLAILGVTAVLQAAVVVMSGSVALLGDTVHNAADALTAVPLGIAFVLGRRAATRRYTYGFGRAEDLAGIVIVLVVAASAVYSAWVAVDRLIHPEPLAYLPVVAAAAVIGFLGNEAVARYRIRVGRRIGSAALVADGLHARTDGFTSLAVLAGAGGAALGWGWADPVVGLVITVAIVVVLRDAAREVYRRIMDAVDPALVDTAEAALTQVPGVLEVGAVRLRWIGHQLRAETDVVVDGTLTVVEAHQIAVAAEHELLHQVPRLQAATVHTDHPPADGDTTPHSALAHHRDGHHTWRAEDTARREEGDGTGTRAPIGDRYRVFVSAGGPARDLARHHADVPGTHPRSSDPMTAIIDRLVARYGQDVTPEVIRSAVEGHTRRFAGAAVRTFACPSWSSGPLATTSPRR